MLRVSLVTLSLLVLPSLSRAAPPDDGAARKVLDATRWYGQASLRFEAGGTVVYVDPVDVPGAARDADVILITHDHGDHHSKGDVVRLAKPSALVVAPFAVSDPSLARTAVATPGKSFVEHGVEIEAVPAYNVVKTSYHPRKAGYVGYVIGVGGVRVYVSGDTERIPEMKALSCDIAFVPLGQKYTMSGPEEAAQAVQDVKARIAVPYHWGKVEGTREDALRFRKLLEGKAEVVILEVAR